MSEYQIQARRNIARIMKDGVHRLVYGGADNQDEEFSQGFWPG